MSAAAPKSTSNIDAEALMKMSLFEMMQKGIDPCDSKVKSLVDEYYKSHFGKEDEQEDESDDDELDDDDEAGLMDYRKNEITIVEKDRRFTIILEFSFDQRDECDLPTPEDFEARWCAKYDPKEIAAETMGEEHKIIDAFWSSGAAGANKLTIILDNMDEYYTEEEVLDDLTYNSLEDAQYEAAPGDGFWVVSVGNLTEYI